MIHRTKLLDPLGVDHLSEPDRRVLDGAQNAGHGPRYLNTERHSSGAMQQVVNPSALIACGCGGPGSDSDISEGHSTLSETFDDISSPPDPEGALR
jgi:hypothetical protein